MAKLKVDDLIKGLKYVESQRNTFYSNQFPYNCGYIHSNGYQSYDCIGLVKCPINEPDIFYKKSPVGYYVTPGKVIPDTTEIGILNLCTEIGYTFAKLYRGEYLYMDGHGAWYVGDYTDPSGVVNVIECTPGIEPGGVVSSYVDASGNRYNHKGGTWLGKWVAHGKLSKYIQYDMPNKWVIQFDDGNWYYVVNGEVDTSFTGVAQNENGWWYCKNGKVDFTYNGLAKNDNGWWYCEKGKVNFDYNGIVQNENGWWVVRNSKVDFTYNGLAQNEHGWWMCQGGKVDFDYNGLCVNGVGTWVLEKGKVNFDYNGNYEFSGKTYTIKKGKVS